MDDFRKRQHIDALSRELYTLNTHWTGRQLDDDEADLLDPTVRRRVKQIKRELQQLRAGQ